MNEEAKTVDILDAEAVRGSVTLFGVPTTVGGKDFVLITHMSAPLISCKQVDEPKLVSPANLPAPEDPQGECGLFPPFQRYHL